MMRASVPRGENIAGHLLTGALFVGAAPYAIARRRPLADALAAAREAIALSHHRPG